MTSDITDTGITWSIAKFNFTFHDIDKKFSSDY